MAYLIFNFKKCIIFFLAVLILGIALYLVIDGSSYRVEKTIAVKNIAENKKSVFNFVPEACGNDQVFVLVRLREVKKSCGLKNADCIRIMPWSIMQGSKVVQSYKFGNPLYWEKRGVCVFSRIDIVPGLQYSFMAESGFRGECVKGLQVEIRCPNEHPFSERLARIQMLLLGLIFLVAVFLSLFILQLIAFFQRSSAESIQRPLQRP